MSHSRIAILQLPDELLVQVAEGVDITDLHALSLTCRRIRPIAQEGLVQRATLSPEKVWKLVGMLHSHPDLVRFLTHLRLGPIPEDAADRMLETYVAAQEIRRTRKKHSLRDTSDSVMPVLEGMAALFTLAHSLTAMSMSAISVSSSCSLNTCLLLSRKQQMPTILSTKRSNEHVRSDLQGRLEEINVQLDYSGNQLPISLIMSLNLSECSNLKRLVMPYESLFTKPWNQSVNVILPTRHDYRTEPYHMFPPSLESVHMLFGKFGADFPDVQWLDKLMADDVHFPELSKIHLQCEYNILSTAWRLCRWPYRARKLPAALRRWQTSRINLTTAFGIEKLHHQDERHTTEQYITGDFVAAIDKGLATTLDQLENEPDMLAALGYVARSTYGNVP
jgi:hypothetical protein